MAQNFFGRPAELAATAAQGASIEQRGALLWRAAPWRFLENRHTLELTAPDHGIAGAIVSVLGANAEAFGFVVLKHAEAFLEFDALASGRRQMARKSLGWPYLYLDLMFGAELEVNAWRCSTAVNLEPIDQSEADLIIALTDVLCRLDARVVASDSTGMLVHDRVSLVSWVPDTPQATLLPFPGGVKPGRNEPCWCGSGKKYKKCHLDADRACGSGAAPVIHAPEPPRSPWLDVSDRVWAKLRAWAETLSDDEWPFADALVDELPDRVGDCFVFRFQTKPHEQSLAQRYYEHHRSSLSSNERRFIEALLSSHFSYWQATSINPGRSLRLRDLFTEEELEVTEVSASQTLRIHSVLCALVLTIDGVSHLEANHPLSLAPLDAIDLRDDLTQRLRLPKCKAIPAVKLATPRATVSLLSLWLDTVDERLNAPAPQILQNTDGEPFILCEDEFELLAPRAQVEAKLRDLAGIRPPENAKEDWSLVREGDTQHANWQHTMVATLSFRGGNLSCTTNSRERAQQVRRRLAEHLSDLLRHKKQTTTDSATLIERARATPQSPLKSVPDPGLQAALRQFKEDHYATWPDTPLPALSGKTARQASKTATGRRRLIQLINDMEHRQSSEPPDSRYDFDQLRRALNLLD